jgi:hypothetical protein
MFLMIIYDLESFGKLVVGAVVGTISTSATDFLICGPAAALLHTNIGNDSRPQINTKAPGRTGN